MTFEELVELLAGLIEKELEDCERACKDSPRRRTQRQHDSDVALAAIIKVWEQASKFYRKEVI